MATNSKPNRKPVEKLTSDKPEIVRSRSEIERSLSGETTRSKKRARPAASTAFDLNAPPRRQQVIGGNLTGVASRRKTGIFSRYSNIGLTNWAAGVIVVLILTAFFWPQENISTQEVVGPGVTLAPQLGETDLSEAEQNDFLENEAGESALSFSRDDDISRASDFRQQDAKDLKIRILLDNAKRQIKSGKYTLPRDNNATATYKEVLSLNPRNVEAKQGLDFVTGRFLTSGLVALEQNNKSLAENALGKLAVISTTDSEQYLELEAAIEAWDIQRKIEGLLANAKSALAKRALILPAKENALYYYQQALLLDGENQNALAGVQRIGDSYIQQANDAVLNGRYEAASAHLATVSIIDPSHASIPLVEAMIARAKPLAERALAAQQRRLEQQAETLSENQIDSTETLITTPIETPTQDDTRTPRRQTSEQQAFDKQYLKEGLEAYYKGKYSTAAALLQPLADKGIARAQFRLAYMHFLGRGFKADRAIADSIIRAALPAIQRFADDGRSWAQSDIGSLYEDGLVLPRNYTDAVYWYRSAAKQGYPGAQTNLGIMYARGRGVTTSRRKAIEWFQRAAKQGDSVAQRNLETMGAN
ncbi:MAG: sel1 repeat family protein [Arenicella sp.]|nr:sel1 repeat family protein [Arenicella sp.]